MMFSLLRAWATHFGTIMGRRLLGGLDPRRASRWAAQAAAGRFAVANVSISSRPALSQDEFVEWVKGLVTDSENPDALDTHGLRRFGWRPGTSICAKWPQLGGPLTSPHRRETAHFYKAGGPNGDKFDLCKVTCMSHLTPWAFSSACFPLQRVA